MKQRVERLEHALLQLAKYNASTAVTPALTRDEVEAEEEELLDRDDLWHRHQNELEQRFATEFEDPTWVEEMETRLYASLPRLSTLGLKETQIVFHECRDSLCKAEFIHGQHEDPRFLSLALAIPGIEQITVVPEEPLANGEKVSTVYFYREGFWFDQPVE